MVPLAKKKVISLKMAHS